MKLGRILVAVALCVALSSCRLFAKLSPDCHHAQDYVHARERAPLQVPPGLDTPNTQGALVIPTVENAPPPPGPKDQCLDIPPRYQAAPPNKAASG